MGGFCKPLNTRSLHFAIRFDIIQRMETGRQTVKVRPKEVWKYFAHRPKTWAVYSWKRKGLLDGHGVRVKMKFWREGGRIYTTEEEIDRFKEAVREGR